MQDKQLRVGNSSAEEAEIIQTTEAEQLTTLEKELLRLSPNPNLTDAAEASLKDNALEREITREKVFTPEASAKDSVKEEVKKDDKKTDPRAADLPVASVQTTEQTQRARYDAAINDGVDEDIAKIVF